MDIKPIDLPQIIARFAAMVQRDEDPRTTPEWLALSKDDKKAMVLKLKQFLSTGASGSTTAAPSSGVQERLPVKPSDKLALKAQRAHQAMLEREIKLLAGRVARRASQEVSLAAEEVAEDSAAMPSASIAVPETEVLAALRRMMAAGQHPLSELPERPTPFCLAIRQMMHGAAEGPAPNVRAAALLEADVAIYIRRVVTALRAALAAATVRATDFAVAMPGLTHSYFRWKLLRGMSQAKDDVAGAAEGAGGAASAAADNSTAAVDLDADADADADLDVDDEVIGDSEAEAADGGPISKRPRRSGRTAAGSSSSGAAAGHSAAADDVDTDSKGDPADAPTRLEAAPESELPFDASEDAVAALLAEDEDDDQAAHEGQAGDAGPAATALSSEASAAYAQTDGEAAGAGQIVDDALSDTAGAESAAATANTDTAEDDAAEELKLRLLEAAAEEDFRRGRGGFGASSSSSGRSGSGSSAAATAAEPGTFDGSLAAGGASGGGAAWREALEAVRGGRATGSGAGSSSSGGAGADGAGAAAGSASETLAAGAEAAIASTPADDIPASASPAEAAVWRTFAARLAFANARSVQLTTLQYVVYGRAREAGFTGTKALKAAFASLVPPPALPDAALEVLAYVAYDRVCALVEAANRIAYAAGTGAGAGASVTAGGSAGGSASAAAADVGAGSTAAAASAAIDGSLGAAAAVEDSCAGLRHTMTPLPLAAYAAALKAAPQLPAELHDLFLVAAARKNGWAPASGASAAAKTSAATSESAAAAATAPSAAAAAAQPVVKALSKVAAPAASGPSVRAAAAAVASFAAPQVGSKRLRSMPSLSVPVIGPGAAAGAAKAAARTAPAKPV